MDPHADAHHLHAMPATARLLVHELLPAHPGRREGEVADRRAPRRLLLRRHRGPPAGVRLRRDGLQDGEPLAVEPVAGGPEGRDLQECVFIEADLSGADLSAAPTSSRRTSPRRSSTRPTSGGARLERANFEGSDMKAAKFGRRQPQARVLPRRQRKRGADFKDCDARGRGVLRGRPVSGATSAGATWRAPISRERT